MIAQIKGRLVEKNPAHVIIDCSGVGYHVNISLNTYSRLGNDESLKLFTHLIIRDDAHVLYGFAERSERHLFEQLISVSGVGASTAMMMLSSLQPDELKRGIIGEDVTLLKSIKGIGKKSAERIVVDLKDKLTKEEDELPEKVQSKDNTILDEALSALVMLGFSRNAARKALKKELSGNEDLKVEELVKKALKSL